jgi:proton-dependent oligopeptide transporter, POT family
LSFAQRWGEIRSGFERPFWVANFTEIFERVAYYGMSAVLAIYLSEQLHFSTELTGSLLGITGFVVYALPILCGTLADRFGFRRSLMFAYCVLTVGYFLLGSLDATWLRPLRMAVGDKSLVLGVLLIPALGPGLVKPCVAGTTARASAHNVRSLGYSIYYTLVNIGGALGPSMAWLVRKKLGWGIENVFRVSACCALAMFLVTLFFYQEPGGRGAKVESLGTALKNIVVVLKNLRFVTFLLISSGFYIVFWQIWITMPLFMRTYVNPNADTDRILSIEGITVICLQILITYISRKMDAVKAIALGFLISALSWILLAVHPTMFMLGMMLVMLALGEIIQASRYYEYCSRLAPPGQQGLYMGCAFLPIAIGYFIAGPLGGYLLHEFGQVRRRPNELWWVIAAIGVATAALMWLYDKMVKPGAARGPSPQEAAESLAENPV